MEIVFMNIILMALFIPVKLSIYAITDYINEKKAAKDKIKLRKNQEKADELYRAWRQKQIKQGD